MDQVQSCIGAVLEQFGDSAMPLMEGLMPQVGALLTAKSSVEERRVGICVMDDIMEHTKEGGCCRSTTAGMHSGQCCLMLTITPCLQYHVKQQST